MELQLLLIYILIILQKLYFKSRVKKVNMNIIIKEFSLMNYKIYLHV